VTSRWPFPGDSPAVRARKVAWAYRAALTELGHIEIVAELDARFISWDEEWVCPVRTYDDEDWVTAREAGGIAGVAEGTISIARVRGRIKARRDGRRFLYRVADVRQLSFARRERRANTTVRVNDNGRSVSA